MASEPFSQRTIANIEKGFAALRREIYGGDKTHREDGEDDAEDPRPGH